MITTASRPYVIAEPRLGVLDLGGSATAPLAEEDARALAPLFSSILRSTDRVPSCDVLFLYATIGDDGAIVNCGDTLETIIATSGATIVVVATANPIESYIAATSWLNDRRPERPSINLVMTTDRRDRFFAPFFVALFTRMKQGMTMPMAWVSLAPQNPNLDHAAPQTLAAMSAGHIAFGRRPSFWQRLFRPLRSR